MSDGILYEPRAFWSIANTVATDRVQRVRLDKRHFFNGERHPIQITRLAVSGINYLMGLGAPGAENIAGIGADESLAIIQRCGIKISVPQRYYLNARTFIPLAALAPRATAQPPALPFPSPYGAGTLRPSSLWGQCNLDFDKPLVIPRTGQIEWDLSAHTPWTRTVAQARFSESVAVPGWMLYQEVGGLFAGSVRSREIQLARFTGSLADPDPLEKWPYPADAFGVPPAPAPGGSPVSSNWWAPTSRFPAAGRAGQITGIASGFGDQESTRDGSTEILGVRTYIDQTIYDAEWSLRFADGSRPSQLALRTGCRIRTTNAGSKTWWWRPGAPLGLVLDSITPANVYHLPEPITLGPGEQLDAELELPANFADVETTFHIGVALNGYAEIEG